MAGTEVEISRVPPTMNLQLYAGDGIAFRFRVKDKDGNPVPLNGAVTSQIKAKRTDSAPRLSWSVDDSQMPDGIVILSLTGEQTESLISAGKKFSGVWDLQYTPTGSEPVTFVQGKVLIDVDVTH